MDIRFTKDIKVENCKVSPLLFINLVENAFKHGVEHLRDEAYVYMDLYCDNKLLKFTIENNFDSNEINEKKGIGIENIKRRLELIYSKQYRFTTEAKQTIYKSELEIRFK